MKSKYALPKDGGLITAGVPRDIYCRYEKVPTEIFETEYAGVQHVADQIVSAINAHQDTEPFLLGLTTGKTPLGLYRELVKRHEEGKVSFKHVAVVTLDEFYPIAPNHKQSRNYRIREELISHIDIEEQNVHVIDATASVEEISAYCKAYDKIASKVDFMVIGMGEKGQLGFNEPGSYEKSRTRLVQLSLSSRKMAASLFSKNEIPTMAITMGLETILKAKRIVLMAWGEHKAEVVKQVVEGEETDMVPASILQQHADVEVVIDEIAGEKLTRVEAPWVVGQCEWTKKLMRKAVIWLCGKVDKPILKLTYQDYMKHSLADMLDSLGKTYDEVNIEVFNDMQHTISGWPGGKPHCDDTTRPVPSNPFPKRVIVFSPHPDDDVISMGGTFIRLVEQGHDVHVAYQTSGNVAVYDDVVVQHMDTAREIGLEDRYDEVRRIIASKVEGEPEPRALLNLKGAIRRAEAKAAVRSFGLNDETNAHFLNLPFYETGGIKKGELGEADIDIVVNLLREVKPHQIYAAGDLTDPHGTHRVCIEAVLGAWDVVKGDDWAKECHIWLYRGAWQEWDLGMVDMAVPLSPDELIKKRHAIFRHLSQKDIVPFPGEDHREFWQRAEDRTQNTARQYDKLGMAEYQAIEVFVRMI